MKRLFIAVLPLIGLAVSALAQSLSPPQFTEEIARTLRARAPGTAVTIKGDMEILLKDASGEERTIYLDNAYRTYSTNPKALHDVVDMYVRSYLEPLRATSVSVDRARIVPVIKDRAWLAEVRAALKARAGKSDNVFEDFNEDLVVVYAEDSPGNIRYLSPGHLTEVGVKPEELRALAVGNLRKLLPQTDIRRGPLVSMIVAGGNYEASLLLFDDLWTGGKIAVDGDVVVAVPARDLLLFTGSKNRAGITKLRQLSSKF